MNEDQDAAYIVSQSVCALIEAMGMTAENNQRIHRGQSMAYTEEAFTALIERYGIHHNSVIGFYRRDYK